MSRIVDLENIHLTPKNEVWNDETAQIGKDYQW